VVSEEAGDSPDEITFQEAKPSLFGDPPSVSGTIRSESVISQADEDSSRKQLPVNSELEAVSELLEGIQAPLEGEHTTTLDRTSEETKEEVTDEPGKPQSDGKGRKSNKGRSTDSRATARTAETMETATEKDKSVDEAEADVERTGEEVSMTEYEEQSVTETEERIAETFGLVTSPLTRRTLSEESDDFLGEILAFAESQNKLDFTFDGFGDGEAGEDGLFEEEILEVEVFEEVEEEIVDEEEIIVDDDGDELMGRLSSVDDYAYAAGSRTRESRSLQSIPEVVEFGYQDDGEVLSKRTKSADDDDIPFDEACKDLQEEKAKQREKVKQELLEEIPELLSVYDVSSDTDIDGLMKIVTSYKERLETLMDERKELETIDSASFDDDATSAEKPDAVERTRKMLEALKVASIARRKVR